MADITIRFNCDVEYRVRGVAHPDNPVFKAGTEHTMREDLARRWIKRGVAEVTTHEKKKAKPEPATVTEKPESKDGDKVQAGVGPAPSTADGDNGDDKPVADNRSSRKAVARNNRK